MNKIINGLLFLLLFTSCNHTTDSGNEKPSSIKDKFNIPVVIQKDIDNSNFHFQSVAENSPSNILFLGKFSFCDTLHLLDHRMVNNMYDRELWDDRIFDMECDSCIEHDGFQIFTDYNKTIRFKEYNYSDKLNFYPVFVVNETNRAKYFRAKDGSAFGIQEAIDSSGKYPSWFPIEHKGNEFCGVGHFYFRVNPQEFVLLLFPKYSGNIKTNMRLRLNVGYNMTYVSKTFQGTIDNEQFTIKRDFLLQMLRKHETLTIQHNFYGANPKGFQYDPF